MEETEEESKPIVSESTKTIWTDKSIGITVKILEYYYLISVVVFILGLKKRYGWVIPVIVVLNVFSLIQDLYTQTVSSEGAIIRLFHFIFGLFLIYFFTQKEVRNFFQSKGSTIF